MAGKYLILVICFMGSCRSGWTDDNVTILCPKYCNCDLFDGVNRAICSDKKLIDPSVDVPDTVEVLDLSYNEISSLEDKCFQGLKYLINLTISNNAVHTIYLDAFYDLASLQFIDLSNNRLEYFDPRIFENNLKLFEVNLNENKFMTLKNEPFIISSSIQYLSLQKSQLMQITSEQFVKLPLLTKLDLSDNFMITLSVTPFIGLKNLKYLNILNNRWTTCHDDLKMTVEGLRAKQIIVRVNVCNYRFGPKFERMMMAPTDENSTDVAKIAEAKDISTVWKNYTTMNKTDDVRCEVENLEAICQLYDSCSEQYSKLIAEQTINRYRTKLIDHNDRVYVALYSGLFLGVFVTSSFIYIIYLICGSRYWKKRKLQRKLAERRRRVAACRSATGQQIIIPRPLRTVRPPPHSCSQAQSTRYAMSRANQREFLLARLFERPERRRNMLQNQTHASRTQQSFPSQNLDTEHLIRPSPIEDDISPISLAVQDADATTTPSQNYQHDIESTQTQNQQNRQEPTAPEDPLILQLEGSLALIEETTSETIVVDRPETPPPPYHEIIRD